MTSLVPFRDAAEDAVSRRFSMSSLAEALPGLIAALGLDSEQRAIVSALRAKVAGHTFRGLVRATFFIELVKLPEAKTTTYAVRWRSRLGPEDPRFATVETCAAIFVQRLRELVPLVADGGVCEVLSLYATRPLVPHELPVDYRERVLDGPLHTVKNMYWLESPVMAATLKLRKILRDPSINPDYQVFRVLYEKIAVKAYFTDRVLVGVYLTNREKRWETHPRSVHYALRGSCLRVEHELIDQVCHFAGFPPALRATLEEQGLLSDRHTMRCPITMDVLDFGTLRAELLNPQAGRSAFQVGHLNPLKAINDDPASGHTSENIGWISADGNRIQGHLTLVQTRELLDRIFGNYGSVRTHDGGWAPSGGSAISAEGL